MKPSLMVHLVAWLSLAPSILAQATNPAAAPIAVAVSATTAPTRTVAAERNIRFQFDGIPYSDVVERFAQMAGKPLLADTNVVGTLTYNDPKSYSYAEALDTLNVMLGMKGVMLVEDGNNLRMVPFKQLPSMPIRILRGLESVGDVRPGEVVTVVLDVEGLDPKEVADSILPMLSTAGSAAPLSRGRGLVVTDRLANIQRVRTLLNTIGTGPAADRQMKTYTLMHASGAIVSDLLNRTFGVSTAPKRTSFNPNTKALDVLPPDPNDYITSVYDEASRVLVLFGPFDRLQLAEELINKFEQKGGGGDVRIYYPQSIKAEELANMIRQAIPGVAAPNEPSATAATKARVIADASQNRLVVAAPLPGQLEQIEQLITRVDKGALGVGQGGGDGSVVPLRSQSIQLTKIFRPRATEATNVAAIVRQALTRREKGGSPGTTASVSYDPGSQSVVVTGSVTDVQTAADIVSQLETGTSQPTPLQTRFIEIGSPEEVRRIQPLVEQLYRNQSADGSSATVAHAKILADTESGRLIVTANEEHLTRIETLVRQLRADKPAPQSRHLRVLALKNTRTDTALSSIQSLITERMTDRRFATLAKPSVVADGSNNRLLVTATDEQFKEIEDVIAVVDVPPGAAQRELSVIPLQVRTASEIIPLVTQLASQLGKPGQTAPSLMADPTGKQIIVLAAAQDLERIKTLVQQFDASAATSAPRQVRGVELYSRTAADFTPLVQQLYQEQIRGQPEPAGGPATVLAETKSNRIMVSGGEKEITRVEAIIRQLDPLDRRPAQEETRVIRLKSASAPEIVGLIEKSLNAQTQQVRVLLDARSNSLVVTGDRKAVEAAWQLVQQLDTKSDNGTRELQIIELKSADAATLAPTLSNHFAELLKDQRGANYVSNTKIIPDTLANRLVVTGSREDIDAITALVAKFDNSPQQAPGVRVFKLNMAEAAMMAPIVSNAMLRFDARGQAQRRVTVTADEKSNSLIVSGTRTDLQDAESVIEKLDGESAQKERVLRVFDVKGDPDALSALAQKVFAAQNPGRNLSSLLSVTPEPAGKRILVLAPPSMLAQMETVLATLDARPDQGVRELHPVELKNGTASELLPRVTQIYAEQSQGKTLKPASIYSDAGGARILVQGTAEQAASIQQIVDTLASESRPAREVKVFDLGKLSEAQRVLPLVQQLYRDQIGSSPQLGTADAQMVSDGKTGRLFITARADQIKIIEDIVTRLQVNAGAAQPERETRTVEVGTAADVQRLQPLVQQLYLDHWKDRQDTDPADAQIIADPRTGRLIISGKPEHLRQIEVFVQQLGGGGKARAENRQTRVIDLTTASAVELASTVRTLYTEEAKGRLGGQAPDTLITPDTGGNRLIVVGDTNELAAIENIVHLLDKGSAQSASARVFKIKSADPDKVAEILTSSLVRFDAYGRPQKRATVSVDAKTRTLIVTGDPKELQGVSLIIEQLDQSLGAQPERKTRVVNLKQGKAATMSTKVRQLYNDRIKSQPELSTSDLLILEEPESNQLIISGNEAQLLLVDQLVTELNSALITRTARETKLLDVGSSDELTRLQPLVEQLYMDRFRGRDASDPADAKIISDPKNARFIVTGRTNHIAEIESILERLRSREGLSQVRDTSVFDLTTANAVELTATVRTLYQEQAKNRPGAPAADTMITPDTSGNRIIVTGATNEIAVVEDIIRKLDKVGAQSASTRVFKLKSADPDKVVEILGTALVRYDAYGRPQKRVSVVTDAKTRTIIATGDPKELQSASVIIEQLDTSLGTQAGRSMRVLTVKNRTASELAVKVRQVFLDRSKSQPDLSGSEALIMEDATSNQLIVAGTEPQLAAIEEIAVLLQAGASDAGRSVRVIALERNSASGLSSMLSQLYSKQMASTDPSQRLLVSVGGNDRSLVVEAPEGLMTKIADLVKSLDLTDPNSQNVIQTVRLTKSRAEDLADAVNRTLTNRTAPGTGRRVNVTAVAGANSLLVNGPTNVVQDVMKLIRELDLEGGGGGDIEVRIYKLENGTAREVSAIIQQLLQTVSRNRRTPDSGGGGGEGRRGAGASVSVDERSNSLIISATEAHFRVVEKILPTLDKAPDRSDRDVQFVWLRKAKAYDVSSTLDTLFQDRPRSERPVVEPDLTANSLTIIARRGDLPQIQDLITRLDGQARESAIQVRLRPLDRMAAEQMARMLENIYPQMSGTRLRVTDKVVPPPGGTNTLETVPPTAPEVVIAIDKAANALILSGPAQELDNVDRLVTELTFNFSGSESEFRLFPIKDADPVVVARTLTDLLRQDAVPVPAQPGQPPQAVVPRQRITVVAEPRTRSIIVRGRPTDFALMESLIRQLDNAGQISQLEFHLVPLTNAAPEKVLPLVQQMVTQLSTSRPGEPVSVLAEPLRRGLVVIARDVMFTQVEKLIRSLDVSSPHVEAEVRIIALKKASAPQLALVLQNMLKPGPAGESTTESRELQEQIRRLQVGNGTGTNVVLDLTHPIRIVPDAPGAGSGNRLVITSTPDNLAALSAIVELMDTVPVLEGVKVRFLQLDFADATTVSQSLTSIFTQGRQLAVGPSGGRSEPGDQGKALVNPLNVAVDTRSNTLLLSGQEETLDLAVKIARDLDMENDRFVTDIRLFRLRYASAIRLLPVLQAVFTEGAAVPGSEGMTAQVSRLRILRDGEGARMNETSKVRAALTIQADEPSNVIIVAARSDNLPLISEIIEQLDIPAASGLESVRVYPLQHGDPGAVQKILLDLYSGSRSAALRAEDKPVITVDARTGSLIVAGNEKSFAIIDSLLAQLDQKLPFDLRDITLFPLENADANVVAITLQKLMDARVTQRATLNQGQADALKVIIMADQRSNSLLIGGAREGFELVQNLAKQLDLAGPALSGRVRLVSLQFADARVMASTLANLFEQRYAALRNAEGQRNKPVILADTRSNSLLVAANQEDNRTLDELLTRLDAKQENPALTLTVLPLKHNDSARVATTLESLFAARLRAQVQPGQAPSPGDQIKIEPDSLNNSLIVSASKENLELMRTLLEQIDKEPTVADGVFEMFTLQFAEAQRVSTILKSLVDQGLYRPGRPTGPGAGGRGGARRDVLSISVESRSNTLIVSASPENLAVVREVIKRVDNKDMAATADVRVFQLKKSRASSLSTTLTQMFLAKQRADSVGINANERSVPATVLADDRMNTLLVTGGKEAFDLVERLLPQLDGDGEFVRLNFRVFPLKKATATKLRATLQPIFSNRPPKVRGEPVDPITIVSDGWVNALIVGAAVDDMGTVEKLIEQLDTEASDKGLAIHVFPLLKADARKVATTIQGLFRENTPNQELAITVTADERMNALVVSCGEADAKRVGELVRKLDTDQVARVSEIKVFPLRYARAESMASTLNTALNTRPSAVNDASPNAQTVLQFITRTEAGQDLVTAALKEGVLITPDARMNSLIVSAPVDYMGLLEQVITRLDASSPQQAKIKVFPMQNADARQMADIITQMFRMSPSATTTAGNQRSIEYTLVRASGAAEGGPEESIASATVGTAEQNALTITVDPRTNSLLVGGTEHYVELVSQIIESLDSSTALERDSEVIRMKNSQALEVATAIRSFLDQERQKLIQSLGADAAAAVQRSMEQEVAVVAEPTSNTLLLSANRRYFTKIREIIEEIDRAQPQVLIQVLLAEVTLDNATDLGMEWTYTGESGGNQYNVGSDMGVANQLKDFGGFSTAVTGKDFTFLLRALRDQGRLEVLSRPQIVTADNKAATINIGQRVPLVDTSRLDTQNNLTTYFRYEDVGVNLTVTPKISPDGFVKMEIGTTNSALSSSSVLVNKSSSAPIINQRKATTTVSAQSGQTIIIGGLIATTDDKRVRKIPFFGDIPYIGAAFRSTSVKRDRKELLILLTPQILENVQTKVPLEDANKVLRKQLDESEIHDLMKRGPQHQRILEPLYPTNGPSATQRPPVKVIRRRESKFMETWR